MKQTILNQEPLAWMSDCPGRMALLWGVYGCVMALLSRLAGPSAVDQTLIWSAAGLLGLFLAAREI